MTQLWYHTLLSTLKRSSSPVSAVRLLRILEELHVSILRVILVIPAHLLRALPKVWAGLRLHKACQPC